MRLRQLRIKGFKSFANDTIVNFNEDVIGIVGPNGSGKSNIVDAIRWVLGEQKTRELRLEKMTDVIFNGTKTRKKAGVAQVTLDFENSKNILPIDYNNVSISRILYRSGESEYRLNNVPCRLKDISNLFRDTGIGSNSYAILALGMVDDLLADKENARRRMFEQAAGISKFKNRKKETLNKLKATSADLDRVEDLLFEIEKNIKSLERQARKAKKYLVLKDSYKHESVQLALLSINEYKGEYKILEEGIKEEEDKYRDATVTQRKLEAVLEKVQQKNLTEEIKLSQKQKELNQIVGKIRSEENEKGIWNQKLIFSKQNIETNTQSQELDNQSILLLRKESDSLSELLVIEGNNHSKLKELLKDHKTVYTQLKLEFEQAKHNTDQRIAQQNEIQNKIFTVEKQIAIYSNSMDNLGSQLEQLDKELKILKNSKQAIDQELAGIKLQIEGEKLSLSKHQEESESINHSKEKYQRKIKEANDTLNRINRNRDAKQNEFELLKSMIDNLEGFPESIKYLHKKWKKNVPLVSDLISCDDEYRSALEQYLEPYLNHFVIKDIEEGLQAIDLLTQTQKGKAQFFLLDQIEDQFQKFSKIENAQSALSIIDVEVAYSKLFEFLLKDVFITEQQSLLMDNDLEKDLVLLSKNGDLIRNRHIIAGGSVGLFGGKKIGRKKSLKKLEKLLKTFDKDALSIEKDIRQYEKKLSNLNFEKVRSLINETQEKLKKWERAYLVLESKKNNHDNNLLRIIEKSERNKTELEKYTVNKTMAQESLVLYKKQLDELHAQQNETDELDVFSKKLAAASEQYNSTNVDFIRQENKINSFRKDLEYRENRIREVVHQLERYTKLIDKEQEDIKHIQKDLNDLELRLSSLYKARKEREEELSGVEKAYYEERKKIKDKEDQLRDVSRLLQTKQVLINKKKESYNDIKFKIQSVNERLKIEFNISVNDIINKEVETTYEKEELKEIVFKIRMKLDKFGEVNPMAVETYEEMVKRHESITAQRNDIVSARKSLESTIKEIEKQATEKFLDAFSKVRGHFIEVFRTLFTENDKCDLILLDPDNPLESKIDIIAKPKGKRPQSLSQLSGGEKTLTATALLFALYLLKPAPFCIFDEIDAPLDDINIQKFNKLIKQFSKESQFIIITHNKDTMTELGTMYGIFMQEPGVSGISLVDFRTMLD